MSTSHQSQWPIHSSCARNQELQTLFERANRVIKQIAEAEKFDLILQEAVYRSPRLDITERVLKALSSEK